MQLNLDKVFLRLNAFKKTILKANSSIRESKCYCNAASTRAAKLLCICSSLIVHSPHSILQKEYDVYQPNYYILYLEIALPLNHGPSPENAQHVALT